MCSLHNSSSAAGATGLVNSSAQRGAGATRLNASVLRRSTTQHSATHRTKLRQLLTAGRQQAAASTDVSAYLEPAAQVAELAVVMGRQALECRQQHCTLLIQQRASSS
jgi:hypothetical protein